MAKYYPSWRNLTNAEKALVNNGCGPAWFPDKLKYFIEDYVFGWFFHAHCGHHDWGYLVGGGELRRIYCDLMFGVALVKDAMRALVNALCALVAAPVFFLAVIMFGWLSFNYGEPLSKKQALARAKNT